MSRNLDSAIQQMEMKAADGAYCAFVNLNVYDANALVVKGFGVRKIHSGFYWVSWDNGTRQEPMRLKMISDHACIN